MPILYIETNYLMGVATGRYPAVDNLLAALPQDLTLVLPGPCIAEAFAALEYEQSRRRILTSQLEYQIGQLREAVEMPRTMHLVSLLEEARLENMHLVNDFQARMDAAAKLLAATSHLTQSTPDVVAECVRTRLSDQPTDNLILHCILSHANASPRRDKAMFSANINDLKRGNAGTALVAAGVRKFLRSYSSLMRWLRHLSKAK